MIEEIIIIFFHKEAEIRIITNLGPVWYVCLKTENCCLKTVGTRFDLDPKREWIKTHVAQTINL